METLIFKICYLLNRKSKRVAFICNRNILQHYVFNVTFDQLNSSLLTESINLIIIVLVLPSL